MYSSGISAQKLDYRLHNNELYAFVFINHQTERFYVQCKQQRLAPVYGDPGVSYSLLPSGSSSAVEFH